MTQYTSLFVLLVTLSGALSQMTTISGQFFDCRRRGISCSDGTCDAVGTTCSCDASFTSVLDYHCVNRTVATTTCANSTFCQNGGECRVKGGVDTCFCDQLYTGTNCELPRIELTCHPFAMTVTVRPFPTFATFQGTLYANGLYSDSDCRFVYKSSEDLYDLRVDYGPAVITHCGVAESDIEDGSGTKIGNKYQLRFVVQYEQDFISGTDQMLVATCSYPDLARVTGVVFEVDATTLDPGTLDAEEGTPLVFDILGPDGSTSLNAASLVDVGDELTVTIFLPITPEYPDFLIDSCTAANGNNKTAADYVSLEFVTSPGCPSDNTVVRGNHTVEFPAAGGKRVKIPLYAFMFVQGSSGNKNALFFSCSVEMCDQMEVADRDCMAPTCTGDFTTGFGKRRRRAADGDTRVVGQALTVRFGNATLEEEFRQRSEQTGVETDTAKCLKNPELQTVISILGILLLTLLIALIVVTFYCRRSRHTQGKCVDDGHTMGSSTQTLNMQLPRPRV